MCFWEICGIWWTGPRGQMCLGRAGGTWASRRDASEGVSQKFSGRLERSQQVLGLLGQPGVAFSDWLHSTSPLILADLHQTNGESRSNNGAGTAAKRDGGPRLLRGSDGISGFSAQEDHPVLCRSHPSPSLLAVSPSPSLPSTPPTETPPLGRFNDGEKSAGRGKGEGTKEG